MNKFFITLALLLSCSSTLVSATGGNIYIPHLKETTVLSTLLQAFFNPAEFFSKKVDPKDTDTLTLPLAPRIPNIIPRVEDVLKEPQDGLCQVNTVRSNPGDDLLGPKINIGLTYTQKYEYNLPPGYFDGCQKSGRTSSVRNCCTGSVSQEQDERGRSYLACTEAPKVKLDTKGRLITGVNAPLLDKLDDNLVGGKQSAVKRIYPQELTTEGKLEDIPAQANYTAQSAPGSVKEAPKIYFPHLGAIYDYFLKGIQTALRPFINTIDVTPTLSGDCFTVAENTDVGTVCSYSSESLPSNNICLANRELQKIIYSAAAYAGIPPEILAGIISIESRNGIFKNPKYDNTEVAKHSSNVGWTPINCAANYCGAMGAMQILTTYGVTNQCPNQTARQVNNWGTYACKRDADTKPNPGNLRDNIYAAARMVKSISGTGADDTSDWNQQTVYAVARRYYGDPSCTPLSRFPDLVPSLNEANGCLARPVSRTGFISYCDYLWHYYNDRR